MKKTIFNLCQKELWSLEENSYNDIKQKDSDDSVVREMWKLYRSVIEHEDDLINYRLQWLILAQTLLFTGYSVIFASDSIIGKISNKESSVNFEGMIILIFICVLGFLTTFFSYQSICAAREAIKNLKSYFEDYFLPKKKVKSYKDYKLPDFIINDTINKQGLQAPIWIPRVFIFSWSLLGLFTIWILIDYDLENFKSIPISVNFLVFLVFILMSFFVTYIFTSCVEKDPLN